jgi:GDP-D-mannose dehydratase
LDYIQTNFIVLGNNDRTRDAGFLTDPVAAISSLDEHKNRRARKRIATAATELV